MEITLSHVREIIRLGESKGMGPAWTAFPGTQLSGTLREISRIESELKEQEATVSFYRNSIDKDSDLLIKVSITTTILCQ